MALQWLDMQHFAPVIQLHDQHRSGALHRWRTRFAALAPQLAAFVSGPGYFPDVPGLPGPPALAAVFSWQGASRGHRSVFDPWTNCWSGRWSDGSPQYHVWDNTELRGDQYVQPVTQSQMAHVTARNFAFMVGQTPPRVDVAINVFSDRWGITGWVSKKQGASGLKELPHVGYSVNPRTLIWITHQYDAAGFRPDPAEMSFWMFVEWVDPNGSYSIRGRGFQIVPGATAQVRDGGALGQATYRPAVMRCYANPAGLRNAYPDAPQGMPEP
jgi:hypothetical protein